jgi:hypothetical protein
MGLTGTVKNTFGGSGLTGVDVSDDADVTSVFERVFAGHGSD